MKYSRKSVPITIISKSVRQNMRPYQISSKYLQKFRLVGEKQENMTHRQTYVDSENISEYIVKSVGIRKVGLSKLLVDVPQAYTTSGVGY